MKIYLNLGARTSKDSPIKKALLAILPILGGPGNVILDTLVDDEEHEPDVAIVDSVREAQRVMAISERAKILIAHFLPDDQKMADGFAARYPERVRAQAYVEHAGEKNFLAALIELLATEKESA